MEASFYQNILDKILETWLAGQSIQSSTPFRIITGVPLAVIYALAEFFLAIVFVEYHILALD
jgi:hypothetical protein